MHGETWQTSGGREKTAAGGGAGMASSRTKKEGETGSQSQPAAGPVEAATERRR